MFEHFEEQLQKMAQVAVTVGANIQSGQRLLVRAPLESAPLARSIAEVAYKLGARFVDVQWIDDHLHRIRHMHAPRDSFEYHPQWHAHPLNDIATTNDAVISIIGTDPDLLADQDAGLISQERAIKESQIAPFRKEQKSNRVNWTIVSWPVVAWAQKIFPEYSPQEAQKALWDLIFTTSRLHHSDPVAHWREHSAELKKRAAYLNAKQYRWLTYKGPGTNLKLGLPVGHIWCAAESETPRGIQFVANIPTEEIFTLPHKDETQGVVTCSKPLQHDGAMIEDFSLVFKQGRVVDFDARVGKYALEHLLKTDEGASRLGEVALVPHSSPISQSGVLFFNTLFDENAASHLALGSAYNFCLERGTEMDEDEFAQHGGNSSLAHVDFMIGSDQLHVDGITQAGKTEQIMQNGEWSFVL